MRNLSLPIIAPNYSRLHPSDEPRPNAINRHHNQRAIRVRHSHGEEQVHQEGPSVDSIITFPECGDTVLDKEEVV